MSTKALAKIMFSAAAIAVVGDNSDVKCCKRSDLPVYNKDVCEKPSKGAEGDAKSGTAHAIESNIHNVRVAVASLFDEVQKFGEAGKGYVQDGVENAQWVKTYLGDEHNPAPKIPAIAIGGLAGFIFGLRGGFFRKLIFTSAGALGMASVCYPREARHYSHIAKQNGEKYATIAYNFMYGVKKGDEPLELPKLPSSAAEAWAMIRDLGNK